MLYFLLAALAVALDRLTKSWAATSLRLAPGGTIPLIKDALHFTYVENTGAAFGMLEGFRYALVVVMAAAIVVIVWELIRKRGHIPTLYGLALSLVLGGAIGNLWDRALYGFVVDFVDFRLINFAVFNVADSCICIGAVLLCAWFMFLADKQPKAHAAH